jgi:negative regulator of flagellin synthesis FlgM
MSSIDPNAAQISRYVQSADATQNSGAAGKVGKGHHHGHHQHTQSADSVSLSDDAKSLSAARDAVQATPDVREQKVSDIKQQLSDGTYSVPSRVLARNILDQHKTQQ